MLQYQFLGNPNGRLVTFLHPANTTGLGWGDIVAQMPEVHALCVDLPGFGRSHHHPMTSFMDNGYRVAECLRAVLDGETTDVVGYSLGAYSGFAAILQDPDLFNRAVLTSFQVAPLAGAWWQVPFANAIAPLFTRYGMRRLSFKSIGVPVDGSSWAPTQDPPCSAETLRVITREAAAFDARPKLSRVTTPILALCGNKELPRIKDMTHDIGTNCANSVGGRVPGGHGWPAIDQDLFVDCVRGWLFEGRVPEAVHQTG